MIIFFLLILAQIISHICVRAITMEFLEQDTPTYHTHDLLKIICCPSTLNGSSIVISNENSLYVVKRHEYYLNDYGKVRTINLIMYFQ